MTTESSFLPEATEYAGLPSNEWSSTFTAPGAYGTWEVSSTVVVAPDATEDDAELAKKAAIQQMGYLFAQNHLKLAREHYGQYSGIYAQGIACAMRDQMSADYGVRKAYNKLSAIADSLLDLELPKGK